jgi:hypothetical protein
LFAKENDSILRIIGRLIRTELAAPLSTISDLHRIDVDDFDCAIVVADPNSLPMAHHLDSTSSYCSR